MLPFALAAAVTGAAASGAPGVLPDAVPPPSADVSPAPESDHPKLRNGIVLGLALGLGVGQGRGYPNNSQDIGDPADYASSAWIPGSATTITVMGALSDYLNFGFFLSSAGYHDSTSTARSVGIGVRVEAFPLEAAVPSLSGLAGFAQFGLGSGRLDDGSGSVELASGTQSFIGVGTFYEWPFGHVFGGHFAVGPSLEYDAMFSRPFQESGLLASARFVFYGGN